MKKLTWVILVVVVLGVFFFAMDYLALFKSGVDRGEGLNLLSGEPSYEIEEMASGLEVPWDIAFTDSTRMLITERPGRVRVVENGELLEEPLHVFSEVSSTGEEGLMGIAVDPSYSTNKFVYLSLAYDGSEGLRVKILRMKDEGNSLSDETVLLDNIPAARFHAGSAVDFGPDGKLYVTTGDATNKDYPQDAESLSGKILRMSSDGTVPEDNPIPGSLVYSMGHRNPQGIDWHPESGELYETEHGPSVFDGPAGGDEVNHILPGGNYGWPLVSHEESLKGTISPILLFTPAEAPASAAFYSGDTIPEFRNNFFFGALKGEGVVRIVLDDSDPDSVLSYEKLEDVDFGRIRAVVQGPDGALYFSTSNRDGRGDSDPRDDRIFRIKRK